MATGDRVQLLAVAVQSVRCPSPPEPSEVTFAGGIVAKVSGEPMLALLMAAAAAGQTVDVWYVESKPVPAGGQRVDLVVEATL